MVFSVRMLKIMLSADFVRMGRRTLGEGELLRLNNRTLYCINHPDCLYAASCLAPSTQPTLSTQSTLPPSALRQSSEQRESDQS